MLTEHTRLAVPEAEFVEVLGAAGYGELVQRLWDAGEPFAVVEQDVVPWPGALRALEECSGAWCAYAYGAEDLRTGCVYLGCVRFRPADLGPIWVSGLPWSVIDCSLTEQLRGHGQEVCQHRPSVSNLNPRAEVFT